MILPPSLRPITSHFYLTPPPPPPPPHLSKWTSYVYHPFVSENNGSTLAAVGVLGKKNARFDCPFNFAIMANIFLSNAVNCPRCHYRSC